jgi:hypothetical protein
MEHDVPPCVPHQIADVPLSVRELTGRDLAVVVKIFDNGLTVDLSDMAA